MISKHYRRALAIAAVALFFTNLSQYLFASQSTSLMPLHWILGFTLAALPICFFPGSLTTVLRSPMLYWCYGYLMLSGLWMILQTSASDHAWEEFRSRVLCVLFIVVLLFVFSTKDAQKWTRRGILVAVLLAVAVNLYELFYPLTFSLVLGRSAGLYVNPNQCGIALILGMILSIGLLPQRYRTLFAVVVGTGVFLTFSRASSIGWFISVFVAILTRQIELRKTLVVSFAVLTVITIVVMSQWESLQYLLRDNGVLNKDVLGRVALFSPSEKVDLEDDSTAERRMVAEMALEFIADRPLVGHGVGASKNWRYDRSSHNQYLNMMVDHGILGFFLLPFLALSLTWGARGEARQIGYCFSAFILYLGLFSHNVLEEKYILTIYALLAAMVLLSKTREYGVANFASKNSMGSRFATRPTAQR